MSPRTLFVGDIHLRPGAPETNRRFLDFLDRRRKGLDHLVLLGDIFDYWIGPKHLASDDYRDVLDALTGMAKGGVRISFIYGNRDYFIEEKFARRTGVEVAGDNLKLELGGRSVFCAHGDFIYNKNPKYAAYRSLMKFGPLRSAYLAMPAAVGKSLARGFKKVSRKTTPAYQWKRDDLLEGAYPIFDRGADVLICGHIHLPTHLTCERKGRKRDLYVVGDWDGTCDVVEFDGQKWSFEPVT